jgi:membrane protease YdiL (CAAX protease family)
MQFDEQPMLALNKAIKYGAILMSAIFIIPIMKSYKLYDRQLVGYLEPKIKFILNICKGFALSLLVSTLLIFSFKYFDIRNINFNLFIFDQLFLYSVLFIIFISLIISIIEESFFRGIMIQKSNNLISKFSIIIFSSLIYSLFHFIKIPLIIDDNILWNSGLIELFNVFINFHKVIFIDAAITLFIFGILLGVIRTYFKTISYGIGIHTGFIFIIKIFKQNSSVNFDSSYIFMLSPYDHFTGHLSTIWITTILIFLLVFLYKKNSRISF